MTTAMTYQDTAGKLATWRGQIAELRQKMRDAQAAVEPEPMRDYEFTTAEGSLRLSQLFGTKRDLLVIHNMGRSCPNCTLWADGFNGIYPQAGAFPHDIRELAMAWLAPASP
jgi:predicted dithiol-disulfide oxidoreductase (DUF899 family)